MSPVGGREWGRGSTLHRYTQGAAVIVRPSIADFKAGDEKQGEWQGVYVILLQMNHFAGISTISFSLIESLVQPLSKISRASHTCHR